MLHYNNFYIVVQRLKALRSVGNTLYNTTQQGRFLGNILRTEEFNMENEIDEIEMESKGKGWHNDKIRHSLASRGYKVKKPSVDRKIEQLKKLSDAGELKWEDFEKMYGAAAEEKLVALFDEGRVDMELSETDPDSRQRCNEARIELEEDGETKMYTVERDSPIKLLNISY